MKKQILLLLIIGSFVACKKTEFSPKGPTDIRVENISISDTLLTQVTVKTSEDVDAKVLGDINSGKFSAYSRFDIAYPKAEISAKFNNQMFSTGVIDYTGMTYIGQAKVTYQIRISDFANKKIGIINCSLDAPLK
jgi:hypothetical protein